MPTLVGADCVAVVAVGWSLGVYIFPEGRFSFLGQLRLLPRRF
jgi:hypothetical protein